MKTKKVNVELEIPENMEIYNIWQIIPESINVSLLQRKPKEMVLREVIGRDYITAGEYWTAEGMPHHIINCLGNHPIDHDKTVWELVDANS